MQTNGNRKHERTLVRIFQVVENTRAQFICGVKLDAVLLTLAGSIALTFQHEQVRNAGHGPGGRWQGVRETIPIYTTGAF